MKQTTFDSLVYTTKKKLTRRETFLAEMERVVPWSALLALIEQHCPKGGKAGRPPMPAEVMLRIYVLQQWYALSDPAMEDALHEIESMRRFVGLQLNVDAIPHRTTILKFRRFLKKHALAPKILEVVNAHLMGGCMQMRAGTLVDATIIHASDSTQNGIGARGPEMHRTKKGKAEMYVAEKRGKAKAIADAAVNEATETLECLKAQIRERVEHPSLMLKCQFGFTKVRYRELAKNTAQLQTLFALVNLSLSRRRSATTA